MDYAIHSHKSLSSIFSISTQFFTQNEKLHITVVELKSANRRLRIELAGFSDFIKTFESFLVITIRHATLMAKTRDVWRHKVPQVQKGGW